jgi:hypothetical protein
VMALKARGFIVADDTKMQDWPVFAAYSLLAPKTTVCSRVGQAPEARLQFEPRLQAWVRKMPNPHSKPGRGGTPLRPQ